MLEYNVITKQKTVRVYLPFIKKVILDISLFLKLILDLLYYLPT